MLDDLSNNQVDSIMWQAYQLEREMGRMEHAIMEARRATEPVDGYDLLERYGPDFHARILEERTVAELQSLAGELGIKFSTNYQVDVRLPLSALAFGPKLGAFYANLMGASGYLTMDRWWSRTFNRYRGSLIATVRGLTDNPYSDNFTKMQKRRLSHLFPLTTPADAFAQALEILADPANHDEKTVAAATEVEQQQRIGLARYKVIAGDPSMSDEEAMAQVVLERESYEDKNFKGGTESEKAANTVYKQVFLDLNDVPFNASDRSFMLRTVRRVQRNLMRAGMPISVADIQAVLWYYEKRLYGELGASDSEVVSYEEIAADVVEERTGGGAGPRRSAASTDLVGPDGIAVESAERSDDDAADDDDADAPDPPAGEFGVGEYGGSVLPDADGNGPETHPIKGNADSMLYHTPDSRYYKVTKAEVWFDTEENAEAAGFAKPGTQKDED